MSPVIGARPGTVVLPSGNTGRGGAQSPRGPRNEPTDTELRIWAVEQSIEWCRASNGRTTLTSDRDTAQWFYNFVKGVTA